MNRRSPGPKLAKALQGFLQFKAAEGVSPRTLESCQAHLTLWRQYMGDEVELRRVTTPQIRAFLVWLRTEYKPRRIAGGDQSLAPSRTATSG